MSRTFLLKKKPNIRIKARFNFVLNSQHLDYLTPFMVTVYLNAIQSVISLYLHTIFYCIRKAKNYTISILV